MKETEIQSAICDYLAVKKHFFWRSNNQPIYDPTRKAFRALPKHTPRGVPDIILVKEGKAIFLEVKQLHKYQSQHQKDFEWAAVQAGASYHIVRSIDDVQALGL